MGALDEFEAYRAAQDARRSNAPGAKRRDPRKYGEHLYAKLLEQDAVLVNAGMPPLTPWWKEHLGNFYRGGFRRFCARVGRKGTKSSTICRVAVNEATNGVHIIRPGDLVRWPLLSENKDEARDRLILLREILTKIGRTFEPRGADLQIAGTQIAFSVRAARIGAVSGPISIGITLDELTKWQDKATGANPAIEVIRSLIPSMATQPNGHEFWISSPWAEDDVHFDAMKRGTVAPSATDGGQYVCEAPSWIANDTITEAFTHTLEPDEPTWQREYAGRPMKSGSVQFFDSDAIREACTLGTYSPLKFHMPRMRVPGDIAGAGGDFGFDSDSSAIAVVHGWGADGARKFALAEADEQIPERGRPLKPSIVVRQFARIVATHGLASVMADAHYRRSVEEHLGEEGLGFEDAPAGMQGKALTYVKFRVLLHGGQFLIAEQSELAKRFARQLAKVISTPVPGGGMRIQSPRIAGGGHGDIVSAAILAAWVASEGSGGSDFAPMGVRSAWGAVGRYGVGGDDDHGAGLEDYAPEDEDGPLTE